MRSRCFKSPSEKVPGSPPLLGLVFLLTVVTAAAAQDPSSSPAAALGTTFERDIKPLLARSCGECHGAGKHRGDVDFSTSDTGARALTRPALWREVRAAVRANDMPPASAKPLPKPDRAILMAWLAGLARLEPADPGPTGIRRLASAEYLNTLADLFGVEVKLASDLPVDSPGAGFDNTVSPVLMEKYLLAADEILDRLIVPDQLRQLLTAGQMDAINAGTLAAGTPDGKDREFIAAGELDQALSIPVEGTYTVRIKAGAQQAGAEPVRLAIRFDKQVVGEVRVTAKASHPAVYTLTAKLVAGRTRMSVIFANPSTEQGSVAVAVAVKDAHANASSPPASRKVIIASVEITGPPAKAPSEAQRRIFVAVPGPELSRREAARRIITPFTQRAFRRPPEATEVDTLLRVFALSDSQDEVFSDSVKLMLKAALVSPQFLYRTPDGLSAAPDTIIAIGDHELASRLSYLLWATMPDDELMRLAGAGTLHEGQLLEQQARRLIADPRSQRFADAFATAWLGLDRIATAAVDEKKFPGMTREVRQALRDEGVLFVAQLLRDGGSVLDLLDARYAYVNARTARFYGVSASGPTLQRIALDDANRGGVVTMPGVLLVTSLPERTSPVKRGKWVLEKLLGREPPPPPPDVPPLEKQDTPEHAHLTLRQKTERHREDPACATCHRVMDPIGFGLENFDVVGRWRTVDDNGAPIDATGELPGRLRFGSPAELKKILLERKDDFVRTFIGAVLVFAMGRPLTAYDQVVIDELAERAERDQYRLDGILVGIATSYPFRHRRATP